MVSASKKKLDLDISPIRQEMDIGSIVWLWMVEQESKKSNAILKTVLNAIKEHGVSVTEKETFVHRPIRMPAVNSKGSLKHDKLITNSYSEIYMHTVRELIPIWGYQGVPYTQSQSYEYDMDLLTKVDLEDVEDIGIGNFVSCVANAKSWIDDNYPDYDFDVLKAEGFANKFVNLDDLIGALDKDGIDHPYMRGKPTSNTVASSESNYVIPSEKNNCSVVELSPGEIARNGGHKMEDYDEFKLLCIVKDFLRFRYGQYVIYGMRGGDSWIDFKGLSGDEKISVMRSYYKITHADATYIRSVVYEPDVKAPDRKDIIANIKDIKKILWNEDNLTIKKKWFIDANKVTAKWLYNLKLFDMGKQQAFAVTMVFHPRICADRNKSDVVAQSDFSEITNRLKMQVDRIMDDGFLESLRH